jgi:hypothetical protein
MHQVDVLSALIHCKRDFEEPSFKNIQLVTLNCFSYWNKEVLMRWRPHYEALCCHRSPLPGEKRTPWIHAVSNGIILLHKTLQPWTSL